MINPYCLKQLQVLFHMDLSINFNLSLILSELTIFVLYLFKYSKLPLFKFCLFWAWLFTVDLNRYFKQILNMLSFLYWIRIVLLSFLPPPLLFSFLFAMIQILLQIIKHLTLFNLPHTSFQLPISSINLLMFLHFKMPLITALLLYSNQKPSHIYTCIHI